MLFKAQDSPLAPAVYEGLPEGPIPAGDEQPVLINRDQAVPGHPPRQRRQQLKVQPVRCGGDGVSHHAVRVEYAGHDEAPFGVAVVPGPVRGVGKPHAGQGPGVAAEVVGVADVEDGGGGVLLAGVSGAAADNWDGL